MKNKVIVFLLGVILCLVIYSMYLYNHKIDDEHKKLKKEIEMIDQSIKHYKEQLWNNKNKQKERFKKYD